MEKTPHVKKAILPVLHGGPHRFLELYNALQKNPEKSRPKSYSTLSGSLKALASEGLVEKDAYKETWQLTRHGAAVMNTRIKTHREVAIMYSKLEAEYVWRNAIDLLNAIDARTLKNELGITKEEIRENIRKTSPIYCFALENLTTRMMSRLEQVLSLCQLQHASIRGKPTDEQIEEISEFGGKMAAWIPMMDPVKIDIKKIMRREFPYGLKKPSDIMLNDTKKRPSRPGRRPNPPR